MVTLLVAAEDTVPGRMGGPVAGADEEDLDRELADA